MDLLRSIREAFTRNTGLKLVSLLLAVLIHIVVQRDSVREAEVEVPLALVNTPPGQVFVGSLPESVKVRVRGRWGGIRELLSDRTSKIALDLSEYRDGERFVFEQRVVAQQLPSRHVEVLGVEPAALAVDLEPLAEKVVPIDVTVSGEPAPGFRVGPRSLRVDPPQVTITGPATEVRKIRTVRAAPIELAGTEHDLRVSVRLLPPADRHVRLSQDEVTVQVSLEELEVARTVPAQAVVVRGCPPDSRCVLDPPEVNLRVEGLVRAVTAFVSRPPDNLVYADVAAALQRNERSVRLNVHSIKGLTITPTPAVAKFSVLGEIPPPRGADADEPQRAP